MNKLESATLAGGCFWCTEAIYKKLKGVVSVLPGYTGGTVENPTYEQVCSGKTRHAEAIQIQFDPEIIPYSVILDVFWHTHDPTTMNKQGNDVGTQYRSVVFYHDEQQKQIAEDLKDQLDHSGEFFSTIVTSIEPYTVFYVAENYHQDYFARNENQPYCQVVISPKLHKFFEKYSSLAS